mgnify:CR=1 FL=1
MPFPAERPRRLRATPALRSLSAQEHLAPQRLVLPVFVKEGLRDPSPMQSMPGVVQHSLATLPHAVERAAAAGVGGVMLFGVPLEKDAVGSGATDPEGILNVATRVAVDAAQGALVVQTDLCLDEFTDHGHCGILCDHTVDNDKTLEVLAKTALSHVQAGADMVAPSDMMDGRIAAIRETLDEHGFVNTPIMSYSAKYASAFYGPFRDAAGSAPAFGDRRGYQMDPHNRKEAMKECALDVEEGADILMVKPALSYLDIIRECSDAFDLPMAAYSVSGEYAMIKAAGKAGLIDEHRVMCESALSIYRAGADILITYFAKELAKAMREGELG